MKAMYKHDCEKCIFLGRDIIPQGEKPPKFVDLYLHPSRVEDSLIARYSDEPSDYWAMDIVSMRQGGDIKTQPGKKLLKRYDLYLKGYDRLNTYMVSYLTRREGMFFIKKSELPMLLECIANKTFEQAIDGMETHFGEELSQTIHRTWVDWENKDRDDQIILFPRITKWMECELDPYDPEKILTIDKKKYMDYFMEKLADYLTEATTEKIQDFLNEVNEYGLEW